MKKDRIERNRENFVRFITEYSTLTYRNILDIRSDKEFCPHDIVYYFRDFFNRGFVEKESNYLEVMKIINIDVDKRFQKLDLYYCQSPPKKKGDIERKYIKYIEGNDIYFEDTSKISFSEIYYFSLFLESVFEDKNSIVVFGKHENKDEYFCYIDNLKCENTGEEFTCKEFSDIRKFAVLNNEEFWNYYESGCEKEIYYINKNNFKLVKTDENNLSLANLCKYNNDDVLTFMVKNNELNTFQKDIDLSKLPLNLILKNFNLPCYNGYFRFLVEKEFSDAKNIKMWIGTNSVELY